MRLPTRKWIYCTAIFFASTGVAFAQTPATTPPPEAQAAANAAAEAEQTPLASMPPEIRPLSRAPISLHMVNDAKIVFDTIGKVAGLTVVYDPDFPARRIPVDLSGVTLQQALDIVSMESKAFWKPVTENIIFVVPDQPQKRRDYDEQVVKTFYLSNTVQAQDLTEIVTGLRQLLDLKRLQQLNAQNAIIIRDTPDKLAIAQMASPVEEIGDSAECEASQYLVPLGAQRDADWSGVFGSNPNVAGATSNPNAYPLCMLTYVIALDGYTGLGLPAGVTGTARDYVRNQIISDTGQEQIETGGIYYAPLPSQPGTPLNDVLGAARSAGSLVAGG